ncbi:hypothetical protein ABFX02_05G103300 [Erythranthe guttata]
MSQNFSCHVPSLLLISGDKLLVSPTIISLYIYTLDFRYNSISGFQVYQLNLSYKNKNQFDFTFKKKNEDKGKRRRHISIGVQQEFQEYKSRSTERPNQDKDSSEGITIIGLDRFAIFLSSVFGFA